MAIKRKTAPRKPRTARRSSSTTVMRTQTTRRPAPVRRKRRVTRSKGMLAELFNPQMAQAAGKSVISGAVGGAGALMLNKLLPETMDAKMKGFVTLGAGFVTSALLKMPNVGAGMAGVGIANLMATAGMLAEDDNFSYADDLQALPLVLDEDGGAFLQEDYLQEDGFLQEDEYSYNVGYFPEFGM
jgi:hypothetical protein